MNKLTLVMAVCIASLLAGCQKSELNDLKEAQICLNESTPSTARACLDKVGSNDSAQANKIKCAAVFISEGYNTPVSFIDALDQLNGTPTGCVGDCSATVGAISGLTFRNTDNTSAPERARTDALADEALAYCAKSQTGIYLQIASLFNIGTKTANIAYGLFGGGTPTNAQLETAIGSLPPEDLGNLVLSTYNSSCQNLENASDSTKQYCAELAKAVAGGSTPTDIGSCMKDLLVDPNVPCTP